MRTILLLSFLAIAASLMCVTPTCAGGQDFTLVNDTGVDLHNLFVSPTNSDNWGEDILGEDVLEDGQSVDVSFSHKETECIWDFQVRDEEGNGVTWDNIDLCKYEKITLHMKKDKVWATFE